MKRVFLYARVSTEEQAIHGLSIEAQTAALERWAKANECKVVGTYIDAGISARKPAAKRPELQRLLNDVRAGKGDLVVFTKLDRWFRNIAEYYKVQEVLEKYHVDWRTIQEDYDTSTASGRLKINIMLSVAQDEADRTSERIKAVFETKRQKLEPLTGSTPLGYKIEGKRFIKDPEIECAINEFFQKFLATGSISEARKVLSENYGIYVEYQKAHKMLDNTAYYGHYFGGDNMTPPYISKEEFDKIQSMRRRIVRKSPKNRIYLFSGLIFCGECGARMGSRAATTANYKFYNCAVRYLKGKNCINSTNIGERIIERYLLGMLDTKMKEYRINAKKLEEAKKKNDFKSEISNIKKKLGRLKELYINDLISLEEYKKDHSELTLKLQELQKKEDNTPKMNLEPIESVLQEGWQDSYGEITLEEKREFWRIVLKEIRVYSDRHIEFDLNV